MSPTLARIAGTGHYVPERVLTNAELQTRVDTSDAWIVERTGIRERRIAAPEEASSDMAAHAARAALQAAGLVATDLDLIIVATVTPDQPLPATAVFVQQKIGARADCPAFDIAAACAGFVYGLSIAEHFVRAGTAKHVLVVGVELLSRILDWQDRATCVLFGDGAGAVVVSRVDAADADKAGGRLLSTHLFADGSLASALYIKAGGSRVPASDQTVAQRAHTVRMVGRDIFKFAVKSLASASITAMQAHQLTAEQIDWVIPHQANLRILEAVAHRCEIPLRRFYLNIGKYGNTSSASVPIALDEAVRDGSVQSGQTLLLCALGAGVAWGSAVLRW